MLNVPLNDGGHPVNGPRLSQSPRYMVIAVPSCLRLERQAVDRACSRAWAKTGNRMAAKMAIMAMTTSSSISVKPDRFFMGWPPSAQRFDPYCRYSFEVNRVTPRLLLAAFHRSRARGAGDGLLRA